MDILSRHQRNNKTNSPFFDSKRSSGSVTTMMMKPLLRTEIMPNSLIAISSVAIVNLFKRQPSKMIQFKLPNLGRRYDDSNKSFGHNVNYYAIRHLQGAKDEVMYRVFTMILEKGGVPGTIIFPSIQLRNMINFDRSSPTSSQQIRTQREL